MPDQEQDQGAQPELADKYLWAKPKVSPDSGQGQLAQHISPRLLKKYFDRFGGRRREGWGDKKNKEMKFLSEMAEAFTSREFRQILDHYRATVGQHPVDGKTPNIPSDEEVASIKTKLDEIEKLYGQMHRAWYGITSFLWSVIKDADKDVFTIFGAQYGAHYAQREEESVKDDEDASDGEPEEECGGTMPKQESTYDYMRAALLESIHPDKK